MNEWKSPEMNILALPDGESVPLTVIRSPRARRILLRVGGIDGEVRLVLPRGARLSDGLDFAKKKAGWVAARRGETPGRIPFADGASIPFQGDTLTIRRAAQLLPDIWRDGATLWVAAAPGKEAGPVIGWLKGAARREITTHARTLAGRIGRPLGTITLRDQRTRWGSCSAVGNLNFSWRLILAPSDVLFYVVAHEVAHLAEHNHGKRFWALVAELAGDHAGPRVWLRTHGPELHRYG